MTTGKVASIGSGASHAQLDRLGVAMRVLAGLLAVASTVALGTVGVEASVVAIAVLVPLVLVAVLARTRGA